MPDIPDAAVQAAADAISRLLFSGQPEYGTWLEHDEDLARAALEAAAPLIAAQARREAAKQIAAAIQDRRCGFRACNACLCRREDARVALDAFPKEAPDA